ncbi:Hachiman antiphage defense system protein HamA [Natrialbaceae archaeon AArc-T1-2]|uniref:Hachiman antiphage defense system protein HamA n=1 Tax=Natrialbaceae archaeon AArc-T1-2 TaxID=3053904 RepID=UPI00255B0940|nr:Hachiman antiphage defense system protein HamA [Natrialbaceae archaeon AArc-T1-2]WIV67011.1 SAVED domain-containing protein [Natrialbaceae archaeon AArc-T1-2]
MSESTMKSWSNATLIDQKDLFEYIFEGGAWDYDNCLDISIYCIKPAPDSLDETAFVQFLSEKYPYFVMPEDEVEDHKYPYREAQRRADFDEDSRYDGKLGELVLFVLVDALLELPLVCHKLGQMQEPVQDQKGADALFYGIHEGTESLGVGEAKIYSNPDQGIDSALESTDRFHGAEGAAKTQHELTVARNNLSDNLDKDQVDRLLDVFSSRRTQYKHLHPIFLGYEANWLKEKQKECSGPDELESEIIDEIEDCGIQDDIKETLESDYSDLEKYELVFLMLPLEDVDRFREKLQEEIFPHAVRH